MAITSIGHTSANSGSSNASSLGLNLSACGSIVATDVALFVANHVGGTGITGTDSLSWPSKESFVSANATCQMHALVRTLTAGDITANTETWSPSSPRQVALVMEVVRGATLDATATTGVTESAGVTSIPIHVITPTKDNETLRAVIVGNVSAANTGATFTAPGGWSFVDQTITTATGSNFRVFTLLLKKDLGASTAGVATAAASVTTGGVSVRALSATLAFAPVVSGAPTVDAGPDQLNIASYGTCTLDLTASHSNASGTVSYVVTSSPALTFDMTNPLHPKVARMPGTVDPQVYNVTVTGADSANGLSSVDVTHIYALPAPMAVAVGGVWVPIEVLIG